VHSLHSSTVDKLEFIDFQKKYSSELRRRRRLPTEGKTIYYRLHDKVVSRKEQKGKKN
jgi:hypothetical protein